MYKTVASKSGGENVELTEKEKSRVQAEWEFNKAERAKTEYVRQRQSEYPNITDQLDMQYWDKMNGTSLWTELISSIKTKYPKPSK